MTTNISSDGTSPSICCFHRDGDPNAKCFWNVSFTIAETIISQIGDLSALLPSNWLPCPSNVTCYPNFHLVNNDSTYFLDDGKIFMKNSIDHHRACRVGLEDYCFAFKKPVKGTKSLENACRSFFGWLIESKYDEVVNDINRLSSIALRYGITMCISLPFLIATFVIYMILPELNNLHGFILRNYIMSCFLVFMTNITAFTGWIPIDIYNPFLRIVKHFASLTMFFWLNVMSFDMWWTFRLMEHSRKQSFRKKKIIYSIYAWGSSLLIIAVGFIIEYVPHFPEGLIKPGLEDGCWLCSDPSFLAYEQGPMCIILISNILFFASTAIMIFRQRNASAQHFEGSDSQRHDGEKYRFYIYLKLSILSGIQWFSEVIETVWQDPENIVTYILDLPQLLQGLIIFIIFVWNDRIKRLLSARLGLKDQSIRQWIIHATSRIRTLARGQHM